jgi:hypothetical protein
MLPAPSSPKSLWWVPSLFALTLGLVLVATTVMIPIKADDIWWHLKTGEYILKNLRMPDQNTFSFTAPTYPWLPQEWLAEVVFFGIYQIFGPYGLIGFGILLNGLCCALIYRLTQRSGCLAYLSPLVTLLAVLMMLSNFSLRPYLFGNIFFVMVLYAMEQPMTGGRMRPVMIFLIFTVWANFHSSFIAGLALIFLYLVSALATRLRPTAETWNDVRAIGVDLLVALIACVATPNHIYGLIFPVYYIQEVFTHKLSFLTNMSEWQSADFSSPLGRMISFYLMFCVFAVLGSRLTPRPVHIGLLVAFSFFSYTSIRNIPLLGIAATPLLARHLQSAITHTSRLMSPPRIVADLLRRLHISSETFDRRAGNWLLPGLLVAVLLVAFLAPRESPISYRSLTGVLKLEDLSPQFYPDDLIRQIRLHGGTRRIFNYFSWGGAFIWSLYPPFRVFIDQRSDCYPVEVFNDYFAVHDLEPDWQAVLDRWGIDLIAYPREERLTKRLIQDLYVNWKLEYFGPDGALFSRLAQNPAAPDEK